MAVFQAFVEVPQQVHDLPRKMPYLPGVTGERKGGCRDLVAAGRPPDAEVDPPGIEGLQHAEILGHLEGAVVGQHHTPAADADGIGPGRHLPDEHLGAGSGEVGQAMMLGQPVANVAHSLHRRRQLDGFPEGFARGAPFFDRRLIDHTED